MGQKPLWRVRGATPSLCVCVEHEHGSLGKASRVLNDENLQPSAVAGFRGVSACIASRSNAANGSGGRAIFRAAVTTSTRFLAPSGPPPGLARPASSLAIFSHARTHALAFLHPPRTESSRGACEAGPLLRGGGRSAATMLRFRTGSTGSGCGGGSQKPGAGADVSSSSPGATTTAAVPATPQEQASVVTMLSSSGRGARALPVYPPPHHLPELEEDNHIRYQSWVFDEQQRTRR